MYQKMLVPLDGSTFAERVILYVEPLAEKFGATLVLLQVTTALEVLITQANPEMAAPAVAMVDPQPLMDTEQTAAEDYLSGVAEPLRAKGYRVDYEHSAGDAPAVIVERARTLGADLIAMTTHGRSGLGRLILGSVADAVLRHAPCPVLLVGAGGDEGRVNVSAG